LTPTHPFPFSIGGYRTKLLTFSDLSALQDMLEKCADYMELVYGSPTSSNEAEMLVASLPPDKSLDDKYIIGIFDKTMQLVGFVDAVKDYPEAGDWWVGLVLLAPNSRGRGIGSQLYRAFESWIEGQGAQRVYLGVIEANPRAHAFWERLGFERVEKRQSTEESVAHPVWVMRRVIDPPKQA
jgi:RimJ/RimL family protein N-acetyltransferase